MTEKEFLLSIEKLSSVKNYIDSIKRRLNKNDKKSRLNISSSDIDTSSIEEVEIKTEKNVSTSFTETDSIDNLLKRKEELMSSIEKSQNFIGNTPSYIAHIEGLKAKEIARHKAYMEGFQEKIDAAMTRSKGVAEKINKNLEELNQILEKIESFSNINVRVTKDGDIIIENNSISIPKKWQDTCFDLMRTEQFKDLDIKDMKILAKLWTLINSEENISKKIEIHFESDRIEQLFELLKEHKKN